MDTFHIAWIYFRSSRHFLIIRIILTSWSNCSFPAFISEVDTNHIFRVLSIPSDPFQELIILRWYGRRPFRSSKHFSEYPDTLQIIPTIFAKFSFSATIHWSPSFESDKTKRALFIQPTKLPRTPDFWMDQTFRCKFWNGSKHCRFWTSPWFQRLPLCSFVQK